MKVTRTNVNPMEVLANTYKEKLEAVQTVDVVVNTEKQIVTVISYIDTNPSELEDAVHVDYKSYNFEDFTKMASSQEIM